VNWRADGLTNYNRWDRNYSGTPVDLQVRSRGSGQSDSFSSGANGFGFIDPGLLVDWALTAAQRASWNSPTRQTYASASSAPSSPGTRHTSGLPNASFQNTQSVGSTFPIGPGRLDTQAKVEGYIRERTSDPSFAPTSQNLDVLAKEVTDRGGIIALATHAGGKLKSDDAVVLENGATIDLIGNVDSPSAKWQWLHHGKEFGSTYDPGRNVVDPATGQFKTWGEFISSKGKPVPPYIPLPPGYGSGGGGIDHVDAEWLMRKPQGQLYTDMPGLPASMLNDPTMQSPMLTLGRWVQDQEMPATKESLETFVKMHPDFEMRGDNQIRVKPEALHKYPNDPSAGEWRTVIKDNGSGPAWDFTSAATVGAASRR
jgi:hypothetical protein